MYTACDGCPELHQDILDWISVHAIQVPWMICGDHNVLPHEHEFFNLLVDAGAVTLVPTDEDGTYMPTRLLGERCIDYACVNRMTFLSSKVCLMRLLLITMF